MNTVRPADANETALAWQFALRQSEAACLVFCRQSLPIPTRRTPGDAIERGGYVLRGGQGAEPERSDRHRVRGPICTRGPELLEAGGVATRVVSMPCCDRFAEQDACYRDSILPAAVPRPGVAGGRLLRFGWERWGFGTASRSA